ncbi:MAG TPA: ABC transporter permease [Gaiellaceae bacterium]|nr:ABC transporter permease [Gaiellaceae bacterium]
MTTVPAPELLTREPDDFEGPRRRRHVVWSVIRTQPQAAIGALVLLAVVVVAVLAPWIAPYGEREKVGDVFEPPSSEHWLGLDDAGIDMLTLMLHGARVSLVVGFAAALVTMLIGGMIGLLAGYFGGKTDVVLMRLTDYFLVIPDIPLMLVAAAVWGRSLTNIILIIGVIYWTTTARVVRAQVKSVRERVYVKRARSLGAGHTRVLVRHVLPQVAPLLVAITVLSVAVAIFAETAIAFLGLGDPTLTSWGKLIENAFSRSAISVDAWWAVVPPGLAVVVVVLACTMLGRALEDSLNPRLRVGHLSVRHFRLRGAGGGEAR